MKENNHSHVLFQSKNPNGADVAEIISSDDFEYYYEEEEEEEEEEEDDYYEKEEEDDDDQNDIRGSFKVLLKFILLSNYNIACQTYV